MNERIKKLWVKALRGEDEFEAKYVQGQKALRTVAEDGSFKDCCLGVLCDLHRLEHPEFEWIQTTTTTFDDDKIEVMEYLGEKSILPDEVVEWSELGDLNPNIITTRQLGETSDTLASANDGGYTFAQIADIIEFQL